MNQQQQNHRPRTDISQSHRGGGGGGLKVSASYWHKIFPLDSAFDEAKNILSSHGGFLTVAVYHIIKLTHYNETGKRAGSFCGGHKSTKLEYFWGRSDTPDIFLFYFIYFIIFFFGGGGGG